MRHPFLNLTAEQVHFMNRALVTLESDAAHDFEDKPTTMTATFEKDGLHILFCLRDRVWSAQITSVDDD